METKKLFLPRWPKRLGRFCLGQAILVGTRCQVTRCLDQNYPYDAPSNQLVLGQNLRPRILERERKNHCATSALQIGWLIDLFYFYLTFITLYDEHPCPLIFLTTATLWGERSWERLSSTKSSRQLFVPKTGIELVVPWFLYQHLNH